jgi:transcriptional regulator with XRE-family HTH domain
MNRRANGNPRSMRINAVALRRGRAQLGITQQELARLVGYSERLIRKAEQGGSLSAETIQHICQALQRAGYAIAPEDLLLDIGAVAMAWLEAFDRHGRAMIPYVRHSLAEDFVFVCPGDPAVAPFIGVWRGVDGLQEWLDRYFGVFRRVPLTDLVCTVGKDAVNLRFLESGYIGEQLCGPIRINMHFQFTPDGFISCIDDDYDTQAGADAKANAEKKIADA